MTEKKPTLEYARPRPRRHWTWRDDLLLLAGILIVAAMLLGALLLSGVIFTRY